MHLVNCRNRYILSRNITLFIENLKCYQIKHIMLSNVTQKSHIDAIKKFKIPVCQLLLSQAREVWHLLLHFTLALKHLHLLDEHLLAPEQLHLTKP